MTCFVTFDPAGAQGLVANDTTLAAAAERLGIDIRLECGGRGECDSCRVTVVEGLEHVSWPTEGEFARLSDEERAGGARLACQARAEGDCRVSVPPMSTAGGRSPSEEEARGPEPEVGAARERLREAFDALPPGERAVAAIELQLKVAGDVLTELVETPINIGRELLDSLFGVESKPSGASGRPPAEAPAEAPTTPQGTAGDDTSKETAPGPEPDAEGRRDGEQ